MFLPTEQEKYNVFPYHQVYANALANIFNLASSNQKEDAKEVCILCILSAAALNDHEHKPDELKKQNIYQLVQLMMKEQKQAGLVPVQFNQHKSFLARIAGIDREGAVIDAGDTGASLQ